jgi:polygalacturonase
MTPTNRFLESLLVYFLSWLNSRTRALRARDGQPQPPTDGAGLIDGRGGRWWGFPGVGKGAVLPIISRSVSTTCHCSHCAGYLVRGEDRPRLLHLITPTNVVIEHLYLKDSPYWTFMSDSSNGLEVRVGVGVKGP